MYGIAYDVNILICYRFFHNTGAVAAVFLIVGLAAATICLWIFFFVRRRRRRRRIEHDSAISASLAAAGYNRAPIDDDEDFDPNHGMRQRFGSFSSHPTISTPITDEERAGDVGPSVNLYDPYAEYGHSVSGSGYIPARSDSPTSRDRMGDGSYTSGVSRPAGSGHILQYSTGSAEALLPAVPPQGVPSSSTPSVPPRNPKRVGGQEGQSQESVGGTGLHAYDPPPPDYRPAGGRDKKSGAKG